MWRFDDHHTLAGVLSRGGVDVVKGDGGFGDPHDFGRADVAAEAVASSLIDWRWLVMASASGRQPSMRFVPCAHAPARLRARSRLPPADLKRRRREIPTCLHEFLRARVAFATRTVRRRQPRGGLATVIGTIRACPENGHMVNQNPNAPRTSTDSARRCCHAAARLGVNCSVVTTRIDRRRLAETQPA